MIEQLMAKVMNCGCPPDNACIDCRNRCKKIILVCEALIETAKKWKKEKFQYVDANVNSEDTFDDIDF